MSSSRLGKPPTRSTTPSPRRVETAFDRLAELTGRRYGLFEYHGADDAERVVVLMGSGTGAAREAVDALNARGEKVGMVTVHLYRPFSVAHFMAALPESTTSIAVLDRTKEPGAVGEPLYQDVVAALREGGRNEIAVIGGRYGLSGKEFTPPMVMRVLAEAGSADTEAALHHRHHRRCLQTEPPGRGGVARARRRGPGRVLRPGSRRHGRSQQELGEDHREHTDRFAQGHFVYDSKKSGAMTVSHLRFSPRPITSTYLIENANFVACHQFGFLEKVDMLDLADEGATFLLNSHYGPDEVWDHLPANVQETIIAKKLEFYVVDGHRVAREAELGGRINTVLQTCFFALSEIVPKDEAIAAIKDSIKSAYGKRGEIVLQRNYEAVDASLAALAKVTIPAAASSKLVLAPPVPAQAPDFVQRVTGMIIGGKGDLLPVSALPVDGTFPTETAQWEKRTIAEEIPIWDPEICIDCGRCALVCPHAAIRMKVYDPSELDDAPGSVPDQGVERQGLPRQEHDHPGGSGRLHRLRRVRRRLPGPQQGSGQAQGDQHGRPARSPRGGADQLRVLPRHPELDRTDVKVASIKGSQLLEPLFEFSGACSGCGETPYVKLLSPAVRRPDPGRQRHRLLVDLRRQPAHHAVGRRMPTGRGPAWSNSLFEDNAEFGLGMRLALDGHATDTARSLLAELDSACRRPRRRDPRRRPVGRGRHRASSESGSNSWSRRCKRSTIPGPGTWPRSPSTSSIRASGSSAATAGRTTSASAVSTTCSPSGRNVNILVLDTEVYSNTGGQASKATPRAAVAKFAAGGKDDREEGPRHDRHGVRQRLRRPGRDGGQHEPDGQGLRRGRGSSRARRSSSPTARASPTASTCAR